MCRTSEWLETKNSIQGRESEFTEALKKRFQETLGDLKDFKVYFDEDAILVVVDDVVYINTEDEPFFFIGERVSINAEGEMGWKGAGRECTE